MEGRTALVRFCYPSSQMVNRTWLENYLYESLRFFQCTVLASFFLDTCFVALILVSILKTCCFAVFVCVNDIKSLILISIFALLLFIRFELWRNDFLPCHKIVSTSVFPQRSNSRATCSPNKDTKISKKFELFISC